MTLQEKAPSSVALKELIVRVSIPKTPGWQMANANKDIES